MPSSITSSLRDEMLKASKAFLETLVVVDDRIQIGASLPEPPSDPPQSGQGNAGPGYALGGSKAMVSGVPTSPGVVDPGDTIDFKAVMKGAAQESLICSLLDPTNLAADDEALFITLTSILEKADICVFDWRIRGFADGKLTLEILRRLTKEDALVRHRVFCIYSHYDDVDAAFKTIQAALPNSFRRRGQEYVLVNESFLILWLAKTSGNVQGKVQKVSEQDLPHRLLSEFSEVQPGLVPLFALKALANVRRNTLGILGRFSRKNDGGFVTEMALQLESTTSIEQLAESLGDDLAVVARGVLDEDWLSDDVFEEWLERNENKISEIALPAVDEGTSSKQSVIRKAIQSDGQSSIRSTIAKHLSEKHVGSLRNFAELLCCEPSFGSRMPHLRPGTVISSNDKFFVCVQPVCDTYIRGKKDARRFPFVPVVSNVNEPHIAFLVGGKIHLQYVKPKLYGLEYFEVERNLGLRVAAKDSVYLTTDNKKLTHIGVLRQTHSQRILGLLGFDAGRVGLSESEYFRQLIRVKLAEASTDG